MATLVFEPSSDLRKRVRALLVRMNDGPGPASRQAAEELAAMGPRAVQGLIALLADGELGLAACGALSKVGAPAVGALIEALRSPERTDLAAQALGELGPDAADAVSELTKVLKRPDGTWNPCAASALGHIGDAGVCVLRDLLRGPDPEARELALQGLEDAGPAAKSAAGDLVELLADGDEARRRAAAAVLSEIGEPALPVLIGALESRTGLVRMEAASAVAAMDSPFTRDAAPALMRMLGDPDPALRRRAAGALRNTGAPATSAVDALLRAASDPDERVRTAAVELLGDLAAEAAVPLLRSLLADELLAWRAAKALGQIGPGARDAIEDLVRASASSGETGWRAVEALGRIGQVTDRVEGALRAALKKPGLALKAAEALALLGVGR